jgi:O-antigen/teichoic acid export membrane protein
LLRWTAIAEIFFFAVPLQMDIPILLGRIRTLVWINLLDTALTIALLATFALGGLEMAAISRLIVAVLWFAIYISYIARLIALPFGKLAATYLRSAICAAAAGAPLALAQHQQWFGERLGVVPLLLLVGLGVLTWLAALIAVGHPAWQEVRMALTWLGSRRRAPVAAL